MLKNKNIIYPELSYKITGLLFEIHRELGKYRNEKQYADYFENLLKREKTNIQESTDLKINKIVKKQ